MELADNEKEITLALKKKKRTKSKTKKMALATFLSNDSLFSFSKIPTPPKFYERNKKK